jgi:TonB family protein
MTHWNEPAGAAYLANFALKSTALLAAAWLSAFAMRRRSAAARHLVWMAAFAAVLALPLLTAAIPAIEAPWTAWLPAPSSFQFTTTATSTADRAPNAQRQVANTVAPPPAAPASGGAFNWGFAIACAWLAGSLILLAETLRAWLRMARLRRAAPRFDPGPSHSHSGIPSGVSVLEAPGGFMPMTFGIRRPVVFLPREARAWTEERRAMVLRHEFAHIERGDAAMHLAARAALSMVWWNPLAWTAWREFVKEREKAADDLVLSSGARASDYAGHLLEIARSFRGEPATAWAAVAMARRSQLEGRLLSILDSRVSRKAARRASALAAAAIAIALAAPFAAVRAQTTQSALPPDVDATIRAAAAQKNHEILDNAAAAFEKVQNYEVAGKLLASSLEIRGAVSGEQSDEYAAGLVKMGDLEAKRSNRIEDRALAYYQKAVALGDRPVIAPALLYLGIHALGMKDRAGAMNFFDRAVAVSDSPQTKGKALMWMAVSEQSNPERRNIAEEDYRKSIVALTPNTSESATALDLFARFLARQGRTAESSDMQQQATAARQNAIRASQAAIEKDFPGRMAVEHSGNDVTRPALIHKIEPEYTEEARAAKLEGVVVLYVVVQPDGTVANPRVAKSLGLGLDEKAMESVKEWRFRPGFKNGVPVPVAASIEVNFRLL